jgi:hypothetical protein
MYGIVDLTPAYARDAKKAWRGVRLGAEGQLTIQDELEATQTVSGLWNMHLPEKVKITLDPAHPEQALLKQGKQQLIARILSPAGAKFEERAATPLATSPNPAGQNPNTGLKKLCIPFSINNKQTITVVLLPVREGQPAAVPAVAPLADWQ